MHVIVARNVNHALPLGYDYLLQNGRREDSRVGEVLVAPGPITTVYERPEERVLFSSVRDANPFFHLVESIWMLVGRADAAFLDHFVRDFGARFAEEDGLIHGAYGRRWRNHFMDMSNMDEEVVTVPTIDQVSRIIRELRDNPGSRQAVLAMWDPEVDLGAAVKDKPCNTHVYFRVRDLAYRDPPVTDENSAEWEARLTRDGAMVLDMTVCCRSNDIIMGAYGANAVHFSVLQEYVASMIGVSVGAYHQVSNNYHMYLRDVQAMSMRSKGAEGALFTGNLPGQMLWDGDPYAQGTLVTHPLVNNGDVFLREAAAVLGLFEDYMSHRLDLPGAEDQIVRQQVTNQFLGHVLWPMLLSAGLWRRGHLQYAVNYAQTIRAGDWRTACLNWFQRRLDRRNALGEKK